jgi:hypothetical protein
MILAILITAIVAFLAGFVTCGIFLGNSVGQPPW